MARNGLLFSATAFAMSLVAVLTPFSQAFGETGRRKIETNKDVGMAENNFAGMWVTGDGYIRHELLADGRYIEARGTRENAYQGEYSISDNHIEYKDDRGFSADGDFMDGILFHAGMVLYRRDS